MVMSIRPPETFLDANTNAAVDFKVYISAPNTDPKDESKRLVITDSSTGEVVSNPFLVNADGYPKNTNGNVVAPIIQEQEYAILFESVGGGQQYSERHVKGDAFGISSGGTGAFMVDETVNNFPLAQSTDFTGSNLIYVQSTVAGWEGDPLGPVDGYYAYFTGQIGVPGSGVIEDFFDGAGNQWKRTSESELPFTNQTNIAAESVRNDDQDVLIQANTDAILAINKNTRIITANETYIPTAGTYSLDILAVGAGGGGSGANTAATIGATESGCGGGWCESFSTSTVDASYAIVIGVGGAGTAPLANGVNGTPTTVTSTSITMSALGGEGGKSTGSVSARGGTSSGGDINQNGDDAILASGAAPISLSGGSKFGGSVTRPKSEGVGTNAANFGAGGGGAFSTATTNFNGGSGAGGVVIITEYLKAV